MWVLFKVHLDLFRAFRIVNEFIEYVRITDIIIPLASLDFTIFVACD